ncbi:MAG TPA: hypothetical protein VE133_02770, partial [Candidatus Sulfotelmatobacter sp.]|nr:hypothetical protein [Candidatus Sulfotelmatobacter sp.]
SGLPAQQMSPRARPSAQGTLTVTATIVSSVGLVTGPDGEQHLFLANSPDPADNVARLRPVVMVKLTPVESGLRKAKTTKSRKKKN